MWVISLFSSRRRPARAWPQPFHPRPPGTSLTAWCGRNDQFREETVEAYVDRLTAGLGFDVVFDTVGGDNLQTSFTTAGYCGQVATTNARTTQDLGVLQAKALSFRAVFMLLRMLRGPGRDRHGRILRSLARLDDAGRVRRLVDDSHFTLATVPDAHRRIESGKATGKMVIDIAEPQTAA